MMMIYVNYFSPTRPDSTIVLACGDEANTVLEKGGKNRRRGKNENDNEKRELTFKEEGQGTNLLTFLYFLSFLYRLN